MATNRQHVLIPITHKDPLQAYLDKLGVEEKIIHSVQAAQAAVALAKDSLKQTITLINDKTEKAAKAKQAKTYPLTSIAVVNATVLAKEKTAAAMKLAKEAVARVQTKEVIALATAEEVVAVQAAAEKAAREAEEAAEIVRMLAERIVKQDEATPSTRARRIWAYLAKHTSSDGRGLVGRSLFACFLAGLGVAIFFAVSLIAPPLGLMLALMGVMAMCGGLLFHLGFQSFCEAHIGNYKHIQQLKEQVQQDRKNIDQSLNARKVKQHLGTTAGAFNVLGKAAAPTPAATVTMAHPPVFSDEVTASVAPAANSAAEAVVGGNTAEQATVLQKRR